MSRRIKIGRVARFLVLALATAVIPIASAFAQEMLEEELGVEEVESEAARRLRELKGADPEAKKQEQLKPPFEFYRTQVAPFDILPFIKPNHWVTMSQELEANLFDYQGEFRTAPVRLLNMPQAVTFRADAKLLKGQAARLNFQVMLPRYSRQIDLELVRPGTLRPDDATQAPLAALQPHQMLIAILARDSTSYGHWNRLQALIPATTDVGDALAVDRRRYYRLATAQDPERPPNLSNHPLTWTTISHAIWDDLDPNALSLGQQQALIDWLHWGGQLVITGGASRTLTLVSDVESFLAPYLPGEPSGENVSMTAEDLEPLARDYPPPSWPSREDYEGEISFESFGPPGQGPVFEPRTPRRYLPSMPIQPPKDRPVYLAGLRPRTDDAVLIHLGDDSERLLGIERRVGRGRILMLGFDPMETTFTSWKGYDTFVRRFLLRRPEDPWNPRDPNPRMMLSGPDLSWVRYLGRDLGVEALASDPEQTTGRGQPAPIVDDSATPQAPVAAWLDSAQMPSLCRDALVKASGIEVPGSLFVLKVILAYVIALVPLNWLICRFLLRRRELAWAIVPVLALGFAVAIERAAAFDMGFDSACDEVDLLEIQPGYHRAHLSRFAAMYSTGRVRYTVSYPQDPTALALPLNTKLSLAGEEVTECTWQSSPLAALIGFRVEPRSLSMLRAEQMVDLGGTITLDQDESGVEHLINGTNLELRDAVLIDTGTDANADPRSTELGTIGPGSVLPIPLATGSGEVVSNADAPEGAPDPKPDWIDLEPFLDPLRSYRWNRPEDRGELRLVAWAREPQPGQELEPTVDRHRGFTLIVVHLRFGPPPSPDAREFHLAETSAEPIRGRLSSLQAFPTRAPAHPRQEADRP
ncbi:hypothetical protein BH23PLA1_BH23PLA1_28580 [soil metagenome]